MMKRESDDGKYRTTAVNLSHHLTIQVCHLVPGEKSLLSVCTMNLQLAISLDFREEVQASRGKGSRGRGPRDEKKTQKRRDFWPKPEKCFLEGCMATNVSLRRRSSSSGTRFLFPNLSRSRNRNRSAVQSGSETAYTKAQPRSTTLVSPRTCSIGWEATYTKTRQNLRPSQIPRPSSW